MRPVTIHVDCLGRFVLGGVVVLAALTGSLFGLGCASAGGLDGIDCRLFGVHQRRMEDLHQYLRGHHLDVTFPTERQPQGRMWFVLRDRSARGIELLPPGGGQIWLKSIRLRSSEGVATAVALSSGHKTDGANQSLRLPGVRLRRKATMKPALQRLFVDDVPEEGTPKPTMSLLDWDLDPDPTRAQSRLVHYFVTWTRSPEGKGASCKSIATLPRSLAFRRLRWTPLAEVLDEGATTLACEGDRMAIEHVCDPYVPLHVPEGARLAR